MLNKLGVFKLNSQYLSNQSFMTYATNDISNAIFASPHSIYHFENLMRGKLEISKAEILLHIFSPLEKPRLPSSRRNVTSLPALGGQSNNSLVANHIGFYRHDTARNAKSGVATLCSLASVKRFFNLTLKCYLSPARKVSPRLTVARRKS